MLWGIGGTPEGVISAAAIKCLGGQLLGRLWPRDDDERRRAIDAGYDLDRVLTADDLVKGEDVFFSATGVTDGDVLQGVRYTGGGHATTESLVMRTRSGTVRRITRPPRPRQAARAQRRAVRPLARCDVVPGQRAGNVREGGGAGQPDAGPRRPSAGRRPRAGREHDAVVERELDAARCPPAGSCG